MLNYKNGKTAILKINLPMLWSKQLRVPATPSREHKDVLYYDYFFHYHNHLFIFRY